jgi:hypothetical protein
VLLKTDDFYLPIDCTVIPPKTHCVKYLNPRLASA